MATPRRLARIAGCLYLFVAVSTVFAGLVNARVVVPGDAAATAANIAGSETLFRLGLVAELTGAVAFLMTGLTLYLLLRHAGRFAAAVMAVFVAVGVTLQTMSLLNQVTALAVATGRAPSGVFGPPGSAASALLFSGMQHDAYLIAQTYFGLWLLPLGHLVIRSGHFPRALGVLLMAGCAGHLTDVFTRLLAPGLGAAVSPFAMTPAAVAEITFIAWLLVKAVRTPGGPPVPAPAPAPATLP
ncbi:DUF4386 domain-containing protein [Bailinhaonella thermotolerans]|uniref:DUF4386 domain-containing protein n=1 Tax=Bailinhaonella thermotolerans TaxID=1070861 RepID=A0A3A4AVB2_9ACTN|nr:DUF4386 domain-containing protein [Bailinhaonella thermotolerans]RJL30017.1 DUF4386 domain-containing protein [Bailinhaonella thermotolerans]